MRVTSCTFTIFLAAALLASATPRAGAQYAAPVTPLPAVERPAAPQDELAGHLQAIAQAPDPSSAVDAYARGLAAAPQSAAVMAAFVRRMVDLGVPEMAEAQAQELVKRTPENGLGWAVAAYMSARRGQPDIGLLQIEVAAHRLPDDPFVLDTAGQLVAWYDAQPAGAVRSETVQASAQRLRARFAGRAEFAEAYRAAGQAYRQAAADAQPAPRPPEQEAPPPPAREYAVEPGHRYPPAYDPYPHDPYLPRYYDPYFRAAPLLLVPSVHVRSFVPLHSVVVRRRVREADCPPVDKGGFKAEHGHNTRGFARDHCPVPTDSALPQQPRDSALPLTSPRMPVLVSEGDKPKVAAGTLRVREGGTAAVRRGAPTPGAPTFAPRPATVVRSSPVDRRGMAAPAPGVAAPKSKPEVSRFTPNRPTPILRSSAGRGATGGGVHPAAVRSAPNVPRTATVVRQPPAAARPAVAAPPRSSGDKKSGRR